MQSEGFYNDRYKQLNAPLAGLNLSFPRQVVIGVILVLALIAFEIFNFDSTRFALDNLLGGTSFMGLSWAAILAIAFCAIDFAGLAHLFTPHRGLSEEPKEIWFLTGAWLLGATMNAVMTWWAVSLTLLNHDFGNEVLSRQQLLDYVPIFVAVLIWLTRILFIGAFSVAGDHFYRSQEQAAGLAPRKPMGKQLGAPTVSARLPGRQEQPAVQPAMAARPRPVDPPQREPQPASRAGSRRPPMPGRSRPAATPLSTSSRRRP